VCACVYVDVFAYINACVNTCVCASTHTRVCNYRVLQCVAVRCSVLQCVAVCCSVLQCAAVCCSVLHVMQYVAVR